MPLPRVYVETSIIGYLTSRSSQDVVVAARQRATRDWWCVAPGRFELFASQAVIDECSAGDPSAAAERIAVLSSVKLLPTSPLAERLAASLMAANAIPATEPRDALHIAVAAANGIEYLISLNFRHIANAAKRKAIEQVCRQEGVEPPLICSPEELMER